MCLHLRLQAADLAAVPLAVCDAGQARRVQLLPRGAAAGLQVLYPPLCILALLGRSTEHITHVGRGKNKALYVNIQLHRVRSNCPGVVAMSANSNIRLLRRHRHLLMPADLLCKLPREEPCALLRPLQKLVGQPGTTFLIP